MKEKILQAFVEIDKNREEIDGIYPSGNEYYFIFRGRYFSVSANSSGGLFYIYPKYKGDVANLASAMEHGIDRPELIFVSVSDDEVGFQRIEGFHAWISSKYLGIDDVLRDIGL